MKKKKLKLSRRTIRTLTAANAGRVVGGHDTNENTICYCFSITACFFCQPPATYNCPKVPPPPSFGPPETCFP